MSSSINVALLGFGTVGSGVYEILEHQQERLELLLDRPMNIKAILIQDGNKSRNIRSEVLVTSNFSDIELSEIDVVIEAIVGVEPGFTYLLKAINSGCHIITANKELFAKKGHELKQRADLKGVKIGFEATVAGGVPIIAALQKMIRVNDVTTVEAILNGTTNYILTKMREEKVPFDVALKEAQSLGYAEADPTKDIEGYDALYKTKILADLFTSQEFTITRKGISNITLGEIRQATEEGLRVKHVATLNIQPDQISATVEPKFLSSGHKLYPVEGVDNAVVVTGNMVGELVFQGPGAGKYPTASVMVEDLISIFEFDDRISGRLAELAGNFIKPAAKIKKHVDNFTKPAASTN